MLELGGSDPFIVLDDAGHLSRSENLCTWANAQCGQSCLSPKRILISRKSKPAFLELLKKKLGEVGALGPLARLDLRKFYIAR